MITYFRKTRLGWEYGIDQNGRLCPIAVCRTKRAASHAATVWAIKNP